VGAEEQRERLFAAALFQKVDARLHAGVVVHFVALHGIKALLFYMRVVARLAKAHHLVTQLLEVSRQPLDVRARSRVIRLRSVSCRVKSGEKRRPTRRATRRVDERFLKDHPRRRHAIEMRRGDVLRAIHAHVGSAVIVREQHDEVRSRGARGKHGSNDEGKKENAEHGGSGGQVKRSSESVSPQPVSRGALAPC
jgi:hypothetical protein